MLITVPIITAPITQPAVQVKRFAFTSAFRSTKYQIILFEYNKSNQLFNQTMKTKLQLS